MTLWSICIYLIPFKEKWSKRKENGNRTNKKIKYNISRINLFSIKFLSSLFIPNK